MDAPPIGALVVPEPSFREAMGTGEGAAVLLAFKRGSVLVFYPSSERSFVVPSRSIVEIPHTAVGKDTLEAFLSSLLLVLEAEDSAIEDIDAGGMKLTVEIPRISQDLLEKVQGWLGPRLHKFLIDPGNMHRVTLHLDLVNLPRAHGAGT